MSKQGGLHDIYKKKKKALFIITKKNLKNFNEKQKIFYVFSFYNQV